MNTDVETGQIVLMIKNEDGSFSPLLVNKSHAYILSQFICGFSEDEPLQKLKDKYIKT